ncbi:hypothetical protein [Brucella intermedia]|uniref:hypothetical protein n=1 Tax=Brucella intermedia TaxID=94625 RepID=UPI002361E4EE|nr:hypothetical protein [Brucella intermedia]
MRKPETIERVYMDFDGFFASVESFADKRLRGQPVGVVPFEGTTARQLSPVRVRQKCVASRM